MNQEQPERRAFDWLPVNDRLAKPRSCGLTEIRGPYYTPMGPNYLQDVLDDLQGGMRGEEDGRGDEETADRVRQGREERLRGHADA